MITSAKDYLKKTLDKHDNETWTDNQVSEAMERYAKYYLKEITKPKLEKSTKN